MSELDRRIAKENNAILFDAELNDGSVSCNAQFREIFGTDLTLENLLNGDALYCEDRIKYYHMLQRSIHGESIQNKELRFCTRNGNYIWFSVWMASIVDSNGKAVRIEGKMIDINKYKQRTAELLLSAQTDSMTGLLNRRETECVIRRSLSVPGVHAVLIADIDNLKALNDTLGHSQGDYAIKLVAETLRRQFRCSDTVGRIGGDEFMVFLPCIGREDILCRLISELQQNIHKIYVGKQFEYPVHCSIGASLSRKGDRFDDLYQRADNSLYRAKRTGKDGAVIDS
ncbi:MAG: sensor domain-containing diguanylate cyclase [Clostridiaceae bacterium]|nr:sensor domain-containing diguanylate cyclase [Clostridiaceae bacterium]